MGDLEIHQATLESDLGTTCPNYSGEMCSRYTLLLRKLSKQHGLVTIQSWWKPHAIAKRVGRVGDTITH